MKQHSLITNGNFKFEFSQKFDLTKLVLKFGGILRRDFKAALRHSFMIYSKPRKFKITLLVYATGSIILTNLPFLIDSQLENIKLQNDINTQLVDRIFAIARYGVVAEEMDKMIKLNGHRGTFKLSNNFGLCTFNNVTLSFKSSELASFFHKEHFGVFVDKLRLALPEFLVNFIDNQDFFPAAKISIVGRANNEGIKKNMTVYKQIGQVNISGVKNFNDCHILQKIIISMFKIIQ